MRALLLPVAAQWFAVGMASVREVVSDPVVTPVPTALPPLIGVFSLRGEILAVFDAAGLAALDPCGDTAFAVVADAPLGSAALAASGLPEPVVLGELIGASTARGAVARYRVGDRVATLLDVGTLLAGDGTVAR